MTGICLHSLQIRVGWVKVKEEDRCLSRWCFLAHMPQLLICFSEMGEGEGGGSLSQSVVVSGPQAPAPDLFLGPGLTSLKRHCITFVDFVHRGRIEDLLGPGNMYD